jgi:hypothetical protein
VTHIHANLRTDRARETDDAARVRVVRVVRVVCVSRVVVARARGVCRGWATP